MENHGESNTQEELMQELAEYRLIFEASGIGSALLDGDAIITHVNHEFEDLFGYSRDEIEGKVRWTELCGKEDRDRIENYHMLRIVDPDGAPRHYEANFIRKDGSHILVYVTAAFIPGTKKCVLSIISFSDREEAGLPVELPKTRHSISDGVAWNIIERIKAEERYLRFYDMMTGLYNRCYFEEEIKRLDTKRQLPLSVIIGDIIGTRMVNDIYGRPKGDSLIIKVSSLLKMLLRAEDIVCRWGGDEFAVLLPLTDKNMAFQICERIRKACQEVISDEVPVPLSISLGVATKEEHDQSIHDVLLEAIRAVK